jgi:hypothetical protein
MLSHCQVVCVSSATFSSRSALTRIASKLYHHAHSPWHVQSIASFRSSLADDRVQKLKVEAYHCIVEPFPLSQCLHVRDRSSTTRGAAACQCMSSEQTIAMTGDALCSQRCQNSVGSYLRRMLLRDLPPSSPYCERTPWQYAGRRMRCRESRLNVPALRVGQVLVSKRLCAVTPLPSSCTLASSSSSLKLLLYRIDAVRI